MIKGVRGAVAASVICLGSWLAFGGTAACAATLEGQQFDNTMVLAGRTLRLNGLGLRGVLWVKAFVAGLYLPAASKDPNQILTMPGPKRLRLKVMLEAPSHELTKSFQHGASNESDQAQLVLAKRVETLSNLIDSLDKVHPGDIMDLDYLPDHGVQLRLNDKPVGQPVPGEDLYRVVLKIFVGDRPVDKRMREGLLRGGF
ncbi:MAG: chalcone isomerase family protein [Burkholderiales bacterium]|nr:chalcone isomerase family protein [Burkholderiales bacterium]